MRFSHMQRNPTNPISRAASILALALPLVSCASIHPIASPAPCTEAAKPSCHLDIDRRELVFTFTACGRTADWPVPLEIPSGVVLAEPIAVSCEPDRTVFVTNGVVGRAVGYRAALRDQLMIGRLADGRSYLRTAIFMSTASLGPVQDAKINSATVILKTTGGRQCTINMDAPSHGAQCDVYKF